MMKEVEEAMMIEEGLMMVVVGIMAAEVALEVGAAIVVEGEGIAGVIGVVEVVEEGMVEGGNLSHNQILQRNPLLLSYCILINHLCMYT